MAKRRDYDAATKDRHEDVTAALVHGRGFDWLAHKWGITQIGAYQWAINNGVWTNQIRHLNECTPSPITNAEEKR